MNHRAMGRQAFAFFLLITATAGIAYATRSSDGPSVARIEAVFVLDTTGSMSGLIEGAKRKIWSIANQLAGDGQAPEIRIGLVAYRDRGDVFVTRRTDLTTDVDFVYAELQALQADGGGDTPESVNQALHEAVTQLSWSSGAGTYRVLFLVGDAPPHGDYADDVPYRDTVRLARQRGIVVNTVQCGSLAPTASVWKEIARAAGGRYASIAQDGAMRSVATPMDEELSRLNAALAETVVEYGSEAEQSALRRKLEGALEAPASVAASRLSYLAKSGGRVSSGGGDLIDAVREGELELDALPSEALPPGLRELDAPARAAVVKEKIARRAELQDRIDDLSQRRDRYLREAWEELRAEGKADGFDRQVLETLREQAAAQGIVHE